MVINVKKEIAFIPSDIVLLAVEKHFFTLEEYKNNYESRYNHPKYGIDSFLQLIFFALVNNMEGNFITNNPILLRDRKKLTEKFGVDILTPAEMLSILKKAEKRLRTLKNKIKKKHTKN